MPATLAEYEWLQHHYPDYELELQELLSVNARHYDRMTILTRDGQKKEIYFDITQCFNN